MPPSCYPCAKTSGMFTLQRGDTPGNWWKMRNVTFMVAKWKTMEKVFVAFLHLEVLILYILDMFWYVYFQYVCNVLLMFPVLLQRCFYHLFGQRFECIVHMVSQFLNALQNFAKHICVLLHFFFYWKLFSPAYPPWQLHRLHVIRPHRCRPCTVGRHIHMKKKYRR